MSPRRNLRWVAAATTAAFLCLGVHSCDQFGLRSIFMFFRAPQLMQLPLPSGVRVDLHLGPLVDPESLVLKLDSEPLDPAEVTISDHGPLRPLSDRTSARS